MNKKTILGTCFILLLSACASSTSSFSSTASVSSISSSENKTPSDSSFSSDSSISLNDISSSSIEEEKEDFKIESPNFDVKKINSKEEVTLEDFFCLGNTINVNVSISDEELTKLQSDYKTGYKSEVYRMASNVVISLKNYENTFIWEFDNVGIRQKGNTSRDDIYNDKGELNLNHYKLSFDETFLDTSIYSEDFISKYGNALNADRDFLGMSGLDIKWNKNYDASHIREIYASYLFLANGIITQHIGLSSFNILQSDHENKENSMGLCMIYEPSSKSLIKRSLKSNKKYINMPTWKEESAGLFGVSDAKYGDLYKCSYGCGNGSYSNGADMSINSISNSRIGVGNITGSYIPVYERKTNVDVTYDDGLLRNMINVINNGDYQEIEKYVDLEYLAIQKAVGYVIGNPDGLRYDYNNYMLYFRRTDGKMVIIPIDNDRCFGIIKDWNVLNGLKNTSLFSLETANGNQRNNLLLKTILSSDNNYSKQLYLKYCKEIKKSSWSSIDTFRQYFEMAKSSYPDFAFNMDEDNDNYTFADYMNAKMNQIDLNYSLPGSSGESSSSSSSEVTSQINAEDYINRIYVVGSMNNWGSYDESQLSKYVLDYSGNGIFDITLDINKVENQDSDGYGKIQFKFNAGYNDYSLDWSLNSDLSKLIMNKASNAVLNNVKKGDKVHISINLYTLESTVTIL